MMNDVLPDPTTSPPSPLNAPHGWPQRMALLADSLGLALCLFDEQDRTVLWNPAFLRFFPEHDGHVYAGEHYSANLRRFYLSRLAPDELPHIDRYISDGITRHRTQTRPFIFSHRGRWLRVSSLEVPGGRLRLWLQIPGPEFQDSGIYHQPGTAPGLAANTSLDVLEHVADGVMVLDPDDRIAAVNDHFLQVYGLASKALAIGFTYRHVLKNLWSAVPWYDRTPDEPPQWETALRDNDRFTGAPFEIPLPYDRWIRVMVHQAANGVRYGVHVDITFMKRQQRELQAAEQRARVSEERYRRVAEELHREKERLEKSEARFRTAFDYSGVATTITSFQGALLDFNDAFCRLLGYSRAEMRLINFNETLMPTDSQRVSAHIGRLLGGEQSAFQMECRFIRKDQAQVWGLLCCAPIQDRNSQAEFIISHIQDITARKQVEEERDLLMQQLNHQATHDALTGLVNRPHFEQLAKLALRDQHQSTTVHSLGFLDLDGFKQINDTAGHAAGDALLQAVANLLKDSVRPTDVVARLGGDEFGILLYHCDTTTAQATGNHIIQRLSSLDFRWQEQSFRIGVSIGITALTTATDSLKQAFEHADLACYAAKRAGRNRVHVARPCLLQHQSAQVANQSTQIHDKARRRCPVNHAVIVRQRQRQQQPGRKLFPIPHRLKLRAGYTENGHFRRIDQRRKRRTADAA